MEFDEEFKAFEQVHELIVNRARGLLKKLDEKGYFSEKEMPVTCGALALVGIMAQNIIRRHGKPDEVDMINELRKRSSMN